MILWLLACTPDTSLPGTPLVVDPTVLPTVLPGEEPNPPSAEPSTPLPALATPNLPTLSAPISPRSVASPFGPRFSDHRDEMHLGIDWAGTRGEPVLAALAGSVRTVRRPSRDSQSLFVILEHPVPPFTWQNQVFDRIYTSYHHLDDTPLEEHDLVDVGDLVGDMGDTGNAESVHLHFELRLGTHCSIEYQLENPDSSCSTGFSPHVDPTFALDVAAAPIAITLTDLRVTLISDPNGPGIRRIELPGGLVDFATWEGLDPTSDEALEDFDLGWATLVPDEAEEERILHLDLPEMPAWVRVWDTTGVGFQLESLAGPSQ